MLWADDLGLCFQAFGLVLTSLHLFAFFYPKSKIGNRLHPPSTPSNSSNSSQEILSQLDEHVQLTQDILEELRNHRPTTLQEIRDELRNSQGAQPQGFASLIQEILDEDVELVSRLRRVPGARPLNGS